LSDHPTPAELEEFVWNSGHSGDGYEFVTHLVSGCKQCRAAVAPYIRDLLSPALPPERALPPKEDAAYEAAIDRAFAAALNRSSQLLEERKQEALALLAQYRLEELPEIPSHLLGMPLFEALLERSRALRHEDTETMVALAEWALFMAEQFDFRLDQEHRIDLLCRAWIEIGNAHRVSDNLVEASNAMGRATQLFLAGTQADLLAARLFDIQASLYGDLRHFDLAETTLDYVFVIQQRLGDRHMAGRSLIKRSIYRGYQGEPEQAISLLHQGLELIDEGRDPNLVFLAFHNEIWLLVDCERYRDARMALFRLRSRGVKLGGRLNELKLRWLEGHICAGMGELDRAANALQEVKQGFEEAELGYKAALAALELGAVRLQQGNHEESRKEVVPAADVFLALGIRREAQASLLLLKKNFERMRPDAALLKYVIGLLRRGEDAFEERPGPPEE